MIQRKIAGWHMLAGKSDDQSETTKLNDELAEIISEMTQIRNITIYGHDTATAPSERSLKPTEQTDINSTEDGQDNSRQTNVLAVGV